MPMDPKLYAERSRYRLGSTVLLSVTYLAVASVQLGFPALLVFLSVVPAAIALMIITYHRLRNANLSSAWLLLMVLQFGIGPTWHLSHLVTFNVGGEIVSLVPVILGWVAPVASNQKMEPEST